ncbi:hypothetical protein Q0A17_12180 [Citrobacter sp. S2-9]|uniref:DNA-binding protein n=1 Tax=Citrobacter enshiensis TaxID=2971264 RepID=A0ABT8PUY5_9ENTR|nr:hypothetical protein [Citrobacter enshiensis]MDN8600164.1 hypothetical protein [Citrobacter enshiensis]
MMISFLSPRDTIQWFENIDRQLEILCFIISAEPMHRLTLNNLTQNYIDSDIALGSKVGFILFGGSDERKVVEVDTQRNGQFYLPGEFLHPNSLRYYARENQLTDRQFNLLTNSTVSAAIEWMDIFGIQRTSLPALCVLVKGSPPVVINLGKEFKESTVRKIFCKLADIAERDIQKSVGASFELESRLKEMLTANENFDLLEKTFIDHLEALCRRYKASSEDRALIAEFIANKHYSEAIFETTLKNCSFSSLDGFNANSTVKGARNKLTKLIFARDILTLDNNKKNEMQSLSDIVNNIKERRQETLNLVKELTHEGIESKVVDRESLWIIFDRYTARVEKIVSLLDKGGKLFGFIN